MTEQQGNPRQPNIRIAVLFAVLAILAFAAAFYLLDGMQLVDEIFGSSPEQDTPVAADPEPAVVPEDTLMLPEGMPEDFALRIWQEQINSQANIERLVDGEVSRIVVSNVTQDGVDAVLDIEAEFREGPSVQGTLEMRRFGDNWYFARVTGLRPESEPATDTPLPSVDDVDTGLLNTMIEQQTRSASVLEEYATGVVRQVSIREIVDGSGTVTINIEMNESHEDGYGEIVLIEKTIDGTPHWFLARFTKEAAE